MIDITYDPDPGDYSRHAWTGKKTYSVEFEVDMTADLWAIVTGIPLVDASILLEPHLVRGDQ